MIKSVLLQNFQIHRKTKININSKITSIVGPSDRGKSSIVRAIYWVAFNYPSGTNFISHNANGCTVAVIGDGYVIKRRKSVKGENSYIVNDKLLSAVGTSVPEDVANTLRLDKINFQLQHDAPLWFSESSGKVTEHLNKIVNIDLIDRMLKNLASKSRLLESRLVTLQEEKQECEKKVSELSWVAECNEEFGRIEELSKEIAELKLKIQKISSSINELSTSKMSVYEQAFTETEQIEQAKKRLDKIQRKCDRLRGLISMIENVCPYCGRPLT
ncbi:MAG: AAA family ATPase [Halobacteria archaeon]